MNTVFCVGIFGFYLFRVFLLGKDVTYLSKDYKISDIYGVLTYISVQVVRLNYFEDLHYRTHN